jgi:hypothetical protein
VYDVSDRFLDAISGSHRAVIRVQVLPTAEGQFPQFGANPTGGVELPLLDGDIKLTSTADVNGSVDVSASPGTTGTCCSPTAPRCSWSGASTSATAPASSCRAATTASRKSPGPPPARCRCRRSTAGSGCNATASSTRSSSRPGRRTPKSSSASSTASSPAGATLLNYAMFHRAKVPIVWTGYDPDLAKLRTSLTCEDDSHAFLAKLADARGCVLRFDRLGQLLVQPRNLAPGAEPVYTVKPGAGGNLVSWSQKVTRDGVYNYVVARGSDPAHVTSYRLAVNDDENSPLFWDGPFGNVIRYYASPLLLTNESADIAAESILARYKGLPSSLSMMAVPNPALDPLDVVQATLAATTATHLIDQVSIPLGGSSRSRSSPAPSTRSPPTKTRAASAAPPTRTTPAPAAAPEPGRQRRRTSTGATRSPRPTTSPPAPSTPPSGRSTTAPATAATAAASPPASRSSTGSSPSPASPTATPAASNTSSTSSTAAGRSGSAPAAPAAPGPAPPRPTPKPSASAASPPPPGRSSPPPTRPAPRSPSPPAAHPTNPKVYDGQGHTIGRVTITASNVSCRTTGSGPGTSTARSSTAPPTSSSRTATSSRRAARPVTATSTPSPSWGGTNIAIRYNTAVDFVGVDPGSSHTDAIQTWVSSSHPVASSNWEIAATSSSARRTRPGQQRRQHPPVRHGRRRRPGRQHRRQRQPHQLADHRQRVRRLLEPVHQAGRQRQFKITQQLRR